MSQQKNSTLINEHALNREPLPLTKSRDVIMTSFVIRKGPRIPILLASARGKKNSILHYSGTSRHNEPLY